jgi:hypothetical protein
VAADNRRIPTGAVAPAIARAPHAPALLERLLLRGLFEELCVSERDVLGQFFARGRKADGAATAADAAAAVDEGIEHDAEELVGELERALLRAGRSFARQ